jgi:hypothetical protein
MRLHSSHDYVTVCHTGPLEGIADGRDSIERGRGINKVDRNICLEGLKTKTKYPNQGTDVPAVIQTKHLPNGSPQLVPSTNFSVRYIIISIVIMTFVEESACLRLSLSRFSSFAN